MKFERSKMNLPPDGTNAGMGTERYIRPRVWDRTVGCRTGYYMKAEDHRTHVDDSLLQRSNNQKQKQ